MSQTARQLQQIAQLEDSIYTIPPDLKAAILHGKANSVGHSSVQNNRPKSDLICPCCKISAERKPLRLCCSREELASCGIGIPVYFDMILHMIAMLCLVLVGAAINVVFIIAYVKNMTVDYDEDPMVISMEDINKITVADVLNGWYYRRYLDPARGRFIVDTINSFVQLLMVYYFVYALRKIRDRVIHHETNAMSPAYFSVLAGNLPHDATDDELAQFFTDRGCPPASTYVREVHRVYQIQDYFTLREEITILRAKQLHYSQLGTGHLKELADLECEIQEKQSNLQKFNTGIFHRTKHAIIVFQKNTDASNVLHYWKLSSLEYFFKHIMDFLSRGETQLMKKYKLRDHTIRVQKGPDPTDIQWHNFGVHRWRKRGRILLSYICFTVLLYLNYKLCYTIFMAQLVNDLRTAESGGQKRVLLSLCMTCVVLGTNQVCRVIIRILSERECRKTYNTEMKTIFWKLILFNAANSLIVPIFAVSRVIHHLSMFRTEADWEVIYVTYTNNVVVLLTMNAIFGLTSAIFALDYVNKLIKRFLYHRKKIVLTQKELNVVYEGTAANMAFKYAGISKTFMITIFYAPVSLYGLVISILGLAALYWLDKWLLLRRHKKPSNVGMELVKSVLRKCVLAPVIFKIADTVLVQLVLYREPPHKAITMLYKSHYLLPFLIYTFSIYVYVRWFVLPIFRRGFWRGDVDKEGEQKEFDYDAKRDNFTCEYAESNPINVITLGDNTRTTLNMYDMESPPLKL